MTQPTYHPYHLVEPSPWPYAGACGAFYLTVGGVMYFHYSQTIGLFIGILMIVITMGI